MRNCPAFRNRLAGKVAIVTGAGSIGAETDVGIGKAIAILFAGEGASVCLVDRETDRAEATAAWIKRDGGKAIVVAGDVTDAATCNGIVARTTAAFGPPTILVNNVGMSGGDTLLNFDEAAWQRSIDVNLKSAVLMCHAILPAMVGAGGGAIVNIASIAGIRRYGSLGYGPAKAAMIALSGEIAVAHGAQGIRSNTVAPGHVFTPHVSGYFDETARTRRRNASSLGIEGDAWDIASAALFLASDEARFITAVCLPVDGGVVETGSIAAHALIERP